MVGSQCLSRWNDSSCPVCRYCQGDEDEESKPACEVCGRRDNLWMCLICGHIGCGRYEGEHAVAHFTATGHAYSMELQSQRVWDYAGDGYVHRLIQNSRDGKLVELPDPRIAASGGERSQVPPLTDAVESELLHEKAERMSFEFGLLLSSQLETQRVYYEKQLVRVWR
jgi:BRCA1-associated protein